MKFNHHVFALAILSSIPQLLHALGQKHEQIVNKEFRIEKGVSLKIENTAGDITVKTDPTQKTVLLKATIVGNDPETLTGIRIIDIRSASRLTIKTEFAHEKIKGRVNYSLIVPPNINVALNTDTGNISVNQITGEIDIDIVDGNIKVSNSNGKVVANANNGKITVQQTSGTLKLTTEKFGDITVTDLNNSIIASTVKGNIKVSCNKPLPSYCKVDLKTKTGDIELAMPKTSSADIIAVAEKGTVTSEQEITLKPRTTKLNQQAWADFKHQLKGTMGKGETKINLASTNSNITLVSA